MKQKNEATVAGFINDVRAINELPDGRKSIHLNVGTYRKVGEEKIFTHHDVNVVTADAAQIAKFNEIAEDLKKEDKKAHTVKIDGSLASRHNEQTGRDHQVIVANGDSVQFDVNLANVVKEGKMNGINLEGNIARIDINEEHKFAKVTVANHYAAPGAGKLDGKDNDKYHEETTFLTTIVNEDKKNDNYKQIVEGKLAKGDLIALSGQMINNDYTPKDSDKKVYEINVRVSTPIQTIAKKKEEAETVKEAPKAEVKAAEKPAQKPAKKATSKKKTGVKMS